MLRQIGKQLRSPIGLGVIGDVFLVEHSHQRFAAIEQLLEFFNTSVVIAPDTERFFQVASALSTDGGFRF